MVGCRIAEEILCQIVPGNSTNHSQWGWEERITSTLLENVCFLAVSEWIRGFQSNFLLHYFLMQFDFYCFPYEPLPATGFSGQVLSVSEGQCHVLPQLTPLYYFNIQSGEFSHPDDGGSMFIRNVETFNQMCSLRLRICIIFVIVFCPIDPEMLTFL